MSGFFSAKAERDRKERDTPERILHLARSKGEFRVSLRYRDDWLRVRCAELKREGLLHGGKRVGREIVFYPASEAPPSSLGGGHDD